MVPNGDSIQLKLSHPRSLSSGTQVYGLTDEGSSLLDPFSDFKRFGTKGVDSLPSLSRIECPPTLSVYSTAYIS